MARLNFDDLPSVFGVKELCAVLDIGEAAGYTLTRQKDFPSMKIGRQIRISRSGLQRWVENETNRGSK